MNDDGCVSQRLRIVMTGTYPSDPARPNGGVEAAMLSICDALGRRDDVDLHVVSFGGGPTKRFDASGYSVSHHSSGPRWKRALRSHMRTRVEQEARAFGAELVHSQGLAGLVPRRLPCVLTVHGVIEQSSQFDDPGARGLLNRWTWIRSETRQRDAFEDVIAISEYVERRLPTSPTRRVWRIPNAVSVGIPPSRTAPSNLRLTTAGFIGQRKGLIYLISALPAIRQVHPDVRLRVIGSVKEASYKDACIRRATELNVNDCIDWLGPLPQLALWQEITESTMLVVPSLEETAPMAISEAFSLSVPVVATDVGGVAEMLRGGLERFVVPSADSAALSQAIRDLAKVDQLSLLETLKTMAARYAPDRIASATMECYRGVLRLE